VGAEVLRRGGNAVDAAVATAFAMAVVEPFMSCLAGGGSMLIHRPRAGASVAIDFNVEAPRRARADMYRLGKGRSGDLFPWRAVEGDANVHGHLSVAVPGSVAGLTLALERWGTWDLRDAVAPATRIARRGVPVDWYLAGVIGMYAEELARFPEAAQTYLRDGRWPPRPAHLEGGDRVRYPDLARSLELIGKEGASVFYRGEIGEAIESEVRRGGGILDRGDLARYRVRTSAPLIGDYRGVTLLGMPGATGCVTALQVLNVLECFQPEGDGPAGARAAHLRAEALRLAFRTASAGSRTPRGFGSRGQRSPGRPMLVRWRPGSIPTVVAMRDPASTHGASRGAGQGRPGCRPADVPTSARRRYARSTLIAPWCR
jgi:gamma-glutamyltranspeptidase/glutathione hydrolase